MYIFTSLSLLFALLLASSQLAGAQSQGMGQCQLAKYFKSQVEIKRDNLEALYELHRQQVQARELQEHINRNDITEDGSYDLEQLREIINTLEREMGVQESRRNSGPYYLSASLGTVMLSVYVYYQLNMRTPELRAAPATSARRLVPSTALVLSAASSFWLWRELQTASEQKQQLKTVVEKLNSLRDLSQDIAEFGQELEQQEDILYRQLSQLERQGLAKFDGEKISCLD